MRNWDDLRYFLEVAKTGSVRAAAGSLDVSHSTVARRIDVLEQHIDARLFDRTPDGYLITAAGEELLESTRRIDEEVGQISRTLVGGDTRLSGSITVTLPDMAAIYLYMDVFADFCREYPDISLNIEASYDMADLSRREADVALRLLAHDTPAPEYLVGRKLAPVYQTFYASHGYLESHPVEALATEGRWLGWSATTSPQIQAKGQPLPAPMWGSFPNVMLQVAACRAGMGISSLACIVGDAHEDLARVPPGELVTKRDIWLLTHPDLRNTARIRAFRDFITERTEAKAPLLRGER